MSSQPFTTCVGASPSPPSAIKPVDLETAVRAEASTKTIAVARVWGRQRRNTVTATIAATGTSVSPTAANC